MLYRNNNDFNSFTYNQTGFQIEQREEGEEKGEKGKERGSKEEDKECTKEGKWKKEKKEELCILVTCRLP